MPKLLRFVFALQLLVFQVTAAEAYIGPGTAAGAIVTMLGVVGSFFLAIFAIIWYPVKRLLKRRKQSGSMSDKTPPK